MAFPYNLYRNVSIVYRSRIERVSTSVSIEQMRVRYTSVHTRYEIAALVGGEHCIELLIQSQFRCFLYRSCIVYVSEKYRRKWIVFCIVVCILYFCDQYRKRIENDVSSFVSFSYRLCTLHVQDSHTFRSHGHVSFVYRLNVSYTYSIVIVSMMYQ